MNGVKGHRDMTCYLQGNQGQEEKTAMGGIRHL